MPEFTDLVRSKLRDKGKQETVELWEKIYNSYEEDGPSGVEGLILEQLNRLKKGASREIKDIKEMIPKEKKRRR
jgi:hypothetical protein